MVEWPVVTFSYLIDRGVLEIGDGYRAKNNELGGDGPIFLRAGLVQNDGIDLSKAERFRADRVHAVAGKTSQLGDVLVTTKGNSTGRTAFIGGSLPTVVYSPHLSYWRSKRPDVLASGYLRYWSQSDRFRRQLAGMAASTDMAPYLSLSDQRRLRIEVPPIGVQERAARILGALDDKIVLNRRMASTLEALGRLDFRDWRRMQEKAAFRPLHDLCDILSGGTPLKTAPELWAGDIPWVSPKVMGDIHSDEPEHRVTAAAVGRGTRLAPRDSTLVMVRGMGLHERVRVSQAREDVTFNQDVKALVPRAIEPALLLFAVLDAQGALLGRVESSGHGTGVLPTPALANQLVPAPRTDSRARIASRLALLNDRIGVARSEARTLAAIRDRLLPRLLDGSVDADTLAPG